jgi:hypothetical protein
MGRRPLVAAVDLDDTIIHCGLLPPVVASALGTLREAGAIVIPATARPERLAALVLPVWMMTAGVFSGGGLVKMESRRDYLFIPEAAQIAFFQHCVAEGLEFGVETTDEIHLSWPLATLLGVPHSESPVPPVDLPRRHVTKLFFVPDSTRPSPVHIPGVVVNVMRGGWAEVLPADADKGTGLRRLLDLMGLTGCRTAAIGDDTSDLALFAQVDLSFAMPNAVSEVAGRATARLVGQNPAQSVADALVALAKIV